MLYSPKDRVLRPVAAPSFAEFVVLVALMMSIGAFSIDNIMPAFGPIHREFNVAGANDMQLMMTVYMVSFAVMQLVYGPMSDMIGRRPTFIVSMLLYLIGSVAAVFAGSYEWLLAARALQGFGSASTRVVSVALVRDKFEGREMARVMSLTMMVFITVPIFAPAIGGLILSVSTWRMIFVAMVALAFVIMLWFALRMPETLKPEYRQPISLAAIGSGFLRTIRIRVAFGYATAIGVMFGCVMAYINSAQQIFETDVYGLGPWFPAVFGAVAAVMGVAAFVNSRMVTRIGMRRMAHGGTIGFILVAAIQVVVAVACGGHPPLLAFAMLLAGCHFLFSLIMPNFNAMAMEPVGDIAGTASSFIGFYTTLMGATCGYIVGQAFNGTVIPLAVGYLACGVTALLVTLWTEKGRLFQPHHAPPAKSS